MSLLFLKMCIPMYSEGMQRKCLEDHTRDWPVVAKGGYGRREDTFHRFRHLQM